MTPGVFTSFFFRSVWRAFFRVKIAAVAYGGSENGEKIVWEPCQMLINRGWNCHSHKSERLWLWGGLYFTVFRCEWPHFFSSKSRVELEFELGFLCFNSYLMSYLIDNSRLDLIPKNSSIFWHLLNDKWKKPFYIFNIFNRCHWPRIFLAENPVRFDWIRNGRFLCSAAVLQGQLNFKQGRCYHYYLAQIDGTTRRWQTWLLA